MRHIYLDNSFLPARLVFKGPEAPGEPDGHSSPQCEFLKKEKGRGFMDKVEDTLDVFEHNTVVDAVERLQRAEQVASLGEWDQDGNARFAMRKKIANMVPHSETEKRMVLDQIGYVLKYGSAYQERGLRLEELIQRKKEVEGMQFSSVREAHGRLMNVIERAAHDKGFDSDGNTVFAFRKEVADLTPCNEEERRAVLGQIDYVLRYGSDYQNASSETKRLMAKKEEIARMEFPR